MKPKLIAAAAAVLLIPGLAACGSSGCQGKHCPVYVTRRHESSIDGANGWLAYYFLYLSNGSFAQVSRSVYSSASAGSTYGTLGDEQAGAGMTYFRQVTTQDEDAEASAAGDEGYASEVSDPVDAEPAQEAPVEEVPVDDDDSFGDDG